MPGNDVETIMGPRLLAIALASLAPLAGLANDVDKNVVDSLPTAPPVVEAAPQATEAPQVAEDLVEEVIVEAPEPRYVAPTLRDRIGRVWAPVYINGKGPFKLVLDTGANRTALVPSLANRIGTPLGTSTVRVLGATGSAIVPIVQVSSIRSATCGWAIARWPSCPMCLAGPRACWAPTA